MSMLECSGSGQQSAAVPYGVGDTLYRLETTHGIDAFSQRVCVVYHKNKRLNLNSNAFYRVLLFALSAICQYKNKTRLAYVTPENAVYGVAR